MFAALHRRYNNAQTSSAAMAFAGSAPSTSATTQASGRRDHGATWASLICVFSLVQWERVCSSLSNKRLFALIVIAAPTVFALVRKMAVFKQINTVDSATPFAETAFWHDVWEITQTRYRAGLRRKGFRRAQRVERLHPGTQRI